ncbi:MAG: deoxycytidine triphosphate deaminase [Candidatus Proteinoplasmatales archaeon SG8-5]|nr:MAG: deoxycytidine triphosphate deaminase [Candidatus Proteinoplasmatales archaeon SG8-5]
MVVLSDAGILKAMENSDIAIENFNVSNLTPNGYDLTIAEILVEGREKQDSGEVVIPPKTWFAVSTLEYVKQGPGIASQLWIRTSWARKGIISSFGMVDAGFEGTLTLSAYNSSSGEVGVPIGDRFAQIVFQVLDTHSEKEYAERSGHYQGQRGVRLE